MEITQEVSQDLITKLIDINDKLDKLLENLSDNLCCTSSADELEMNEAFIRASKKFRSPAFNSKVAYGKTNFEYANLAEVLSCVRIPLLDEGFSIKHDSYPKDDQHWLETSIQYKNGLSYGTQIWPITIQGKTMQEVGSQQTYIKRYSLCNLCSLFADSDNDAKEVEGQQLNDPNKLPITFTQVRELDRLLFELTEEDEKAMLAWCQVSELNLIPKGKFLAAKKALEAKVKTIKDVA